jgi:glycosyltransferase involved in cell wall biosynthesis
MTIDTLRSEDGGPPRSVSELARAIAQHDVPVELWTLAGDEKVDGVEVRRFDSSLQLARSLKTIDARSAVVHDNGLWRPFNWIVCRTALSLRIPYVVSTRGMLEPWSFCQSRWKKRFAWQLYQRRLLENAASLHATSQLEAATIRSLGLRTPIIVQPNGVNIPPAMDRRNGSSAALYLSRIHEKKGIELLLDAWAKIRPPGWRLHIAGAGDRSYVAKLKAHCAKQNIADSVDWLGELNDTEKWNHFADAELFVLPSHSENFGIVVAEALASAVPVITTTATPWSELDTKECGYCVEPDPDALTAALRKLIATPEEHRRRMGSNGRAWAEQSFSWKQIARNMIDCYQAIINGRMTPAAPPTQC